MPADPVVYEILFALYKLAILIAYRNRERHLITMLPYLIELLQHQKLHFKIFIIEQTQNTTFNRGKLMNVGYDLISHESIPFDCIVMHDIDIVGLSL